MNQTIFSNLFHNEENFTSLCCASVCFQYMEAGARGVRGARVRRRVDREPRLRNGNAIVLDKNTVEGSVRDLYNNPGHAIPRIVRVCLHMIAINPKTIRLKTCLVVHFWHHYVHYAFQGKGLSSTITVAPY